MVAGLATAGGSIRMPIAFRIGVVGPAKLGGRGRGGGLGVAARISRNSRSRALIRGADGPALCAVSCAAAAAPADAVDAAPLCWAIAGVAMAAASSAAAQMHRLRLATSWGRALAMRD
jgi:hypothetical protein